MKALVVVYIFVASLSVCSAVRINLQGSFNLGKDILSSFSRYVHRNGGFVSNRRSGSGLNFLFFKKVSEQIRWIVNSSNLGKSVKSCKGPMGDYIQEYVITLANSIESVFFETVTLKGKQNDGPMFTDPLKLTLAEAEKILADADNITAEDENKYHWVIVVKLISDKFQGAAINFVTGKLDGNQKDFNKVKKNIIQRLTVAIIVVEKMFLTKLCEKFKICEKDHKCTTALHHLLADFQNAKNERAIEFIKCFYENLPAGLSFLHPDTWHEFQVILSDLSYANNSRAKEVLLSVFHAVEARLYFLKETGNVSNAYDQQLVNVILSDMDAVFHSKWSTFPFDTFLAQFSNWVKVGGKFTTQMRLIMSDIREKLSSQPPGLIDKLKKELKTFFELTIEDV